jgi:hypothetical protein
MKVQNCKEAYTDDPINSHSSNMQWRSNPRLEKEGVWSVTLATARETEHWADTEHKGEKLHKEEIHEWHPRQTALE